MYRLTPLFILLPLCAALPACGQKGDLYLSAPALEAAPAPAPLRTAAAAPRSA